jgi:hypothetical protein
MGASYTVASIEMVKQLALNAYLECANPRSESDMGGHDYAYKAGYAQMALYNILKELGVEFEAAEEDDEISNI